MDFADYNPHNNNHNKNNNNPDDDLAAAIAASLVQYENEQNKKIKSQDQDDDYQMAMALKISQQEFDKNTSTKKMNIDDNNSNDDDNKDDIDPDNNGDPIDDDHINDNSTNTDNKDNTNDIDYDFPDDDDGDFDDNPDADADDFSDDDDNDPDGDDDGFDDDDWDDDGMELVYDGQQKINSAEYDEEESKVVMERLMEKRRKEQANINKFWKCGKCQFLNHPSRAICMMCNMPQLDVVHHILKCPKNQLKVCIKCQAYVVPYMYDDHVLDCKPFGGIDNAKNNQAWYVKLTPCEQNAINHVNSLAMKKSRDSKVLSQIIQKIGQVANGLYASQAAEVLNKLYEFMEWTVPIIIRIRGATLVPILMKDTHYRSLFEINPAYKNKNRYNKNDARVMAEEKMFGPVYNKATVFERPKYGCLNVGLRPEGCQKALGYGDCYFLMNDATVRWRTTMTIQDSFAVNGQCGTVKHCNHLLIQLQNNELQELVEAALYAKKGGTAQSTYREIQIHGPVQLNRDIISMNVPNTPQHKKNESMYKKFCAKNMCKLVWFDTAKNAQVKPYGYTGY